MALTNSFGRQESGNAFTWLMADSHRTLAIAYHETLFNGHDWLGRAGHRRRYIDLAQTVNTQRSQLHGQISA
jgi:hypothetical protein